jgi:hypothetical protein
MIAEANAAIASAGITQDIGTQVTAVPRCIATILEEILRDQAADRCTRKCSIPPRLADVG